jgi:hypothetical protein
MYDDGAVVYVNGHEIQRLAMPTGTITAATRSSGHELDNAYETFDWTSVARPYLVPGDNVIAVEIHQQSSSSSDLTFDLALTFETATTCPVTNLPRRGFVTGTELHDVWVGPSGTVWTGGFEGMVGRRADADGGAWCWITPAGTDAWIEGMWGTDETNLWLVGQAGAPNYEALVLRFDGQRFIKHDLGRNVLIQDVWGTGPNDVWVVGSYGVVRHWNGATWEVLDLPSQHNLAGIWGASSTQIWIAGTDVMDHGDPGIAATVHRYVPATRTWTTELSYFEAKPNGNYFYEIKGSSASDVWAVGASLGPNQAIAAHYDGTSWTVIPPSQLPQGNEGFYDVAPRAPGAETGAWFARNFQSTVRYDNNRWDDNFANAWWHLAIDARGDQMWAVGRDGKVDYWSEGGWVTHRPATN